MNTTFRPGWMFSPDSVHAVPNFKETASGERTTTLPIYDELEMEAAIQKNTYKANLLLEAARLLRWYMTSEATK